LNPLAVKSIRNQVHHLFRDTITRKFPAITRDERGVLKFVWSGTDQAVPIHVYRQDFRIPIATVSDEESLVSCDFDRQLLEFTTQHTKERILTAHDAGLSHQSAQDVEKIIHVVSEWWLAWHQDFGTILVREKW
jgi:hypothetical protein